MTDIIIPKLIVDDEFRLLIPPLSDDELRRLESSIRTDGFHAWEPIIVWNNVIVDGHNRYSICYKHGIQFTTKEMQFQSRDAAKLYIIDNQLRRRNLPPAAIGDLKLEEKEIVARQAKERQQSGLKKGGNSPVVPNLAQREDQGRTLEILARDIPMGRESLRKLDVIKQKAKEGDPVAIAEREALISGKKKSIHGSYVTVVGKQKQRSPKDTTTEDGRRICVMCGEPINEGEAHSARPTVHKKCEQEYQLDWKHNKRDSADHDLLSNVAVYTFDSLTAELNASAKMLAEAWAQSVRINEDMGVGLTDQQKSKLDDAVLRLFTTIQSIRG